MSFTLHLLESSGFKSRISFQFIPYTYHFTFGFPDNRRSTYFSSCRVIVPALGITIKIRPDDAKHGNIIMYPSVAPIGYTPVGGNKSLLLVAFAVSPGKNFKKKIRWSFYISTKCLSVFYHSKFVRISNNNLFKFRNPCHMTCSLKTCSIL